MEAHFRSTIEKSNAGVLSRSKITNAVLNRTFSLAELIDFATDLSNKNHHKAIWIIELIAEQKTEILVDHISILLERAPKYKHQSAVRGMSRILYFISVSKSLNVSDTQRKLLIEICLDWFIGDEKVACKVYALKTLTHFSKQYSWITETLQEIISKDYATQSAGYKAACREALSSFKT